MKSTITLIASALLAGLAITAPAHAFDLSANAAVTNNYIWRGLTQTTNDAAVQGGIDLNTDVGFYVGTWVSNVNYGADAGTPAELLPGPDRQHRGLRRTRDGTQERPGLQPQRP